MTIFRWRNLLSLFVNQNRITVVRLSIIIFVQSSIRFMSRLPPNVFSLYFSVSVECECWVWVDQVLSGALGTQASSTTGSHDIAEDYREKSKANILFNSVHWPWRLFSWSFWWEKENFIKMQLCICVWLK